jgi:NAD(P)H-hydrate epimerase
MENAGRGATDFLVREVLGGRSPGVRALVVAGTGNNGGDGLVVARHLAVRGARPIVFLAGQASHASADTAANLAAWRGLDGEFRELVPGGSLSELVDAAAQADVVVDALFGTGLDRDVEGWHADVIQAINRSAAPRFSIDLPSGLDADSGAPLGACVSADFTATLAHYKLGLCTPTGARLAGRVHVVDIGVPGGFPGLVASSARLLETGDLTHWMHPRAVGVHKNSVGHVLVVAGSQGRIGAPQLVARGAMRAGAGLCTIATWPSAAVAIESHALETMTARIERDDPAGSVTRALEGKQVVAIGPGLGLGEEARSVVEHILATWQGPLVVDADALTMFAGDPALFRAARSPILTPHPGEMGRLLGKSPAHVENDRFGAARELVAVTGGVAVLKGAHTVITGPDGQLAVSPVACPALATAGSGDVLSGIIAAMACSLDAFDAACAGVMLHGLSGQAWSESHGGADRGLLASEIADGLPALFASRG